MSQGLQGQLLHRVLIDTVSFREVTTFLPMQIYRAKFISPQKFGSKTVLLSKRAKHKLPIFETAYY